MRRKRATAFGDTELDYIRARARPLTDYERMIARRESPYNKKLVAVGPGGHGALTSSEIRQATDGTLHVFVCLRYHAQPKYVKRVTSIPLGFSMRICPGEKCDSKYVPLSNFNMMTNNPNTSRKCSNYQHRCIECSAIFKHKDDETYEGRKSKHEDKQTQAHAKRMRDIDEAMDNRKATKTDPDKGRYCCHKKHRSQCRECGGASICKHNKLRSHCKECGGTSICVHDKRRSQCTECQTLEELQRNKMFCNICGVTGLGSKKRREKQMCAKCDDRSVDRTEVEIRKALSGLVPPASGQDDTLFGQTCDVVKRRRPDNIWIGTDRVVIAEIDENGGHGTNNYTPECDFGWVMDMTSALIKLFQTNDWNNGKIPHIFVIRMNPDECDVNPQSLQNRVKLLANRINHFTSCELDDYEARIPNVEYHFYHTKCYGHIRFAVEHPNAMDVLNFGVEDS